MSKKPVYWVGHPPVACDMCDGPIRDTFGDVRTVRGQWGNLCIPCVQEYTIRPGKPYGEGYGQRYAKQAGGMWLKVAG